MYIKPQSLVLIDMDGVLADYERALVAAWEESAVAQENGWTPLRASEWPAQIKLPPQLRERWGEEAVQHFRSITKSGTFYFDLEPIENAVEGVRALEESGHSVYICTAPSRHVPTCASEKIAWAEKTLGHGWGERVIITRDKTLVRGDYLIDDKPTVTGIATPTWEHIVFAAAHNSGNFSWKSIIP